MTSGSMWAYSCWGVSVLLGVLFVSVIYGVIYECYIWGYLWVLYIGLFVSDINIWVLFVSGIYVGLFVSVIYECYMWVLFMSVIYNMPLSVICYIWVLYVSVICECYIYESYLIVFSRARPYSFWLLRWWCVHCYIKQDRSIKSDIKPTSQVMKSCLKLGVNNKGPAIVFAS